MTREEAQARMEQGDRKGWVYLIEDSVLHLTKIGWAKDPEQRLKTLQTGHGGEITLVAVIPGTKQLERHFHRKLIYARRNGEWFESGAVRQLLRPVIRDFGLKLTARAEESRTIPEVRRYGQRQKVHFVVEL